jgi:hypothetical protein
MQNFGKIKNIFNTLLVEAIATDNNDKKKLFKEYVKAIKGNEILKAQFLVYNNIEDKVETNEHKATEFVKTNIEALRKYTNEEISEANLILATPILFEQKLPQSENSLGQLHEDISTLIFTEKNPKTVDTIVESLVGIVDYIKENEIKEKNDTNTLPNSMLSNIAVDKFNDRYSELNEDEKSVLKSILESDDDGKQEIYETLSRECIDLVDASLTESDIEAKEKLLAVKDRLLRLEYTSESFITDISKLIELKSDLSE